MVRSYLIENRICYQGDAGVGSDTVDRSNPAEMRAREQAFQDRVVAAARPDIDTSTSEGRDEARDFFASLDTQGETRRQERAAAERQARRGGLAGSGRGSTIQAQLARQLVNEAAQQSLANPDRPAPLDSVDRAPGRNDPNSGFFADAYDELYGGTPPGTGLATLVGGGLLGALTNSPAPADAQAFNIGQLMSMGGVRDPETGAITGAKAGRGTLNMNRLGMITYSGVHDPNYEGAFKDLVRGTAGQNMSGGDDNDSSPSMTDSTPPMGVMPVDPGTTTPEQIDDLAINYLQNPYFLYGGAGNLFQPYGYAPGTMVDLLQTRGMTMPDQAAPNLNLFGNPTDFS